MSLYKDFASVYDILMSDADYSGRTEYLCRLFDKFDRMPTLMLDLACGTGEFSNRFAKKGVQVIGVDISEDMLCVAKEKSAEKGNDILYLCQAAEELDLYGTVDGAVCCLDSLNHITAYEDFCRAIAKVSLFLEPERLFIFDVNTEYKHREILGNNTFVVEQDNVFCVWQNSFYSQENITDISLDFFVKEQENYKRFSEDFSERAYTCKEIEQAIKSAGLKTEAVYADMSENSPLENTDRVIYVTRKG